MLAEVSHGQDVGKNLSRWQWRRDVDPTLDSSCATQDGSAITATTVTQECLHSGNTRLSRLSVPTATNKTASSSLSPLFCPSDNTHYPYLHTSPSRFSIPPSFYSLPALTDFTSPLCPFPPDIMSRHYLHLSCCSSPSILSHFPPLLLSPPDRDKYHLHHSDHPPVHPFSHCMWDLALHGIRRASPLWTLSHRSCINPLVPVFITAVCFTRHCSHIRWGRKGQGM